MEDKILNIILGYFNRGEGEDILFEFPAYELKYKYDTLFKNLNKEILFNLESVKVDNYNYLNNLKDKLFKSYSEDRLKSSKYIINYGTSIQQIRIPYDSLSDFSYPIKNSLPITHEEDVNYGKQFDFIDTVKNHFLYELLKYINSIDLNTNSIYNTLKRKKSSKNYSVDYLNSICELLNSGSPFQGYTFNYYAENILEYYSDRFKKEFEENCNNYKVNNDFNLDDYIETCILDIKNSKSFEPENESNSNYNKSIFNYVDEDYFDRDLYLNNDYLDEILTTHKYVYDDDPDDFCNNFISGYNEYYLMLEADKLIEFITQQSSEIIRIVPPVIPSIFNSEKGFAIFNYILNELDINVLTIDNRPNQTYLNAFWHSSKAKEEIFKIQMSMNDYLKYLNHIFNKNYKSKTMSNGIKKVDIIENYISKYKIN